MLRELHISNLAVIADARIELDAGLNCFTGATGAGKSLVIGALEVLLGLRSPAEMLRPGENEGRVSGVFEIRSTDLLGRIDRVTDIPVSDDGGELLLVRRLHGSGRSSVSLNGQPITLSMLRNVAEHLVDVHGQHDHQYLLRPSNQLEVLDQFGGLWELRTRYHEVYQQLAEAKARREELAASRTLREQQLELYRFQASEIDAAELVPAELEELEARSAVLKNLGKLTKDTSAVHSALYEADGSVMERLKMIAAVLSELSTIDPQLKPTADNTREATIQLEEVSFDLSRYLDRIDLDPSEAAEVDDRLNTINRILSKYGGTIDEALTYRRQIGQQMEQLERATDDLSALEQRITPLKKQLQELGKELTQRRQAAAKKLSPLVEKELAELGMEKAQFQVAFEKEVDAEEASAHGFDQVEFIARTNPGQLAQPLRKIASGGELSRLMLALKSILAQSDRISVLVFDEIDANVGGRLGSVIGGKLRNLARHHQVLCITHLPQIASFAERHLTVRKQVAGGKTQTTVRRMDGQERVEELAEMIGGQRITDTTRAQARELLDSARNGSVAGNKADGSPRRPARDAVKQPTSPRPPRARKSSSR
jgi:DNA repair protein RecN (Recombination protein N)